MSCLHQSPGVDLKSADSSDGCGGSGNLHVCPVNERVVQPISDVIEIVRVSEKNGDNKGRNERRESNASEYSVEIVDLEAEAPETKLHFAKVERDCRICHLSMDGANQDSGVPFELGCSCKDDLAAAHKQCAESWFKIKGNKVCEICGSIAQNVAVVNEAELVEPCNETNIAAATSMMPQAPSPIRNFCQGHRFLNFLLACMVFAFVITWLFHFDLPS